jgi:hypothetical protein
MSETELEVKNRLCRKCRNNKARRWDTENIKDHLECGYSTVYSPIEADGKDCGYFVEVKE